MAEYLPPVIQKFDADVAAYMAKLAEVKAAQDEISGSSGKMSESMRKDAGEAGKAVDGLGEEAKKTGTDVDESMRKSSKSVSDFDRLIRTAMRDDSDAVNRLGLAMHDTQARIKGLQDEFAKTGSKSVLGDLNKAKSDLKFMSGIADDMKAGFSAAFNAAEQDSSKFISTFTSQMGAAFSAIGTYVIPILIGIGVIIAPMIAAMINGAILAGIGGGAIVAGIMIAAKDPRISTAFAGLKKELGGIFTGAVSSFIGPVQAGITDMQAMFARVAPGLKATFTSLSHVVQPLIDGLAGFISGMLPGLEKGLVEAEPVLEVLAQQLPILGQKIGTMFEQMGEGVQGAKLGLVGLLGVIGDLLAGFGAVMHYGSVAFVWMAKQAEEVTRTLGAMVHAMGYVPGFGWLKDLGNGLTHAADHMKNVIDSTNAVVAPMQNADVAFDSTAISIGKADAALQSLITAETAWIGMLQSNDDSLLTLDQSLTAWQKQLKSGKRNWDEMTAAGQANVALLNNVNKHTTDYYNGLAKLHPLTEKQTLAELHATTQLYNQAKAAGATKDELHTLTVEMDALNKQLAAMKSKDITVKINEHFIATGAADPSKFFHGLAAGGVVRAAQGLVSGVLRPKSPGTLVLAGEPGTHGEVFMPLAGISQSRAMKLAQVAGDAYNFNVTPREPAMASMVGVSGRDSSRPIIVQSPVYLDGKMIHANQIGHAQRYKTRTGTTGLT